MPEDVGVEPPEIVAMVTMYSDRGTSDKVWGAVLARQNGQYMYVAFNGPRGGTITIREPKTAKDTSVPISTLYEAQVAAKRREGYTTVPPGDPYYGLTQVVLALQMGDWPRTLRTKATTHAPLAERARHSFEFGAMSSGAQICRHCGKSASDDAHRPKGWTEPVVTKWELRKDGPSTGSVRAPKERRQKRSSEPKPEPEKPLVEPTIRKRRGVNF